jgi:COX assembly protein 1
MERHNKQLPVWVLTPNEEKEARKRWKDHAYKECDASVKVFAECSKKAGFKVLWACLQQRDLMNACILKLQNPEELDKQREILISEKVEKLKQEAK